MNMKQNGQALISLLVFMIIAITITSAAVIITITSTVNTSKVSQGTSAFYIAEAGVENALIRLLRDPSYTGETLVVDGGSTEISVSGTNPYTVVSAGSYGDFLRTVEVTVLFDNNNVMTITNWEELF